MRLPRTPEHLRVMEGVRRSALNGTNSPAGMSVPADGEEEEEEQTMIEGQGKGQSTRQGKNRNKDRQTERKKTKEKNTDEHEQILFFLILFFRLISCV